MAIWYCGSTKWSAVTAWAASTAYSAGDLRRQSGTPSVGAERVFLCVVAGTSGGSQPTWSTGTGALTTDNTVTWQEVTGKPAFNGDLTNTDAWSVYTSAAVALGRVVKNGSNVFTCTTAGTAGASEPSWNTTPGATTADNTATWTCAGSGFGSWAAPHARIQRPIGVVAAGDTVYLSNNHAETQSVDMTLSSVGTPANPVSVVCVSDSAAPPTAVATTATVSTTNASQINYDGCAYVYGVSFFHGSTSSDDTLCAFASSTNRFWWRFERCALTTNNTGSVATWYFGQIGTGNTDDCLIELINTDLKVGHVSQSIKVRAPLKWYGGTLLTTAPTTLFTFDNVCPFTVELRGVDLSVMGSGKNIANVSASIFGSIRLSNCKLGASVNVTTGSVAGQGGVEARLVNCDSADTNYRYLRQTYQGTVTHEATVVRSGGATDGTTPISRKMVTTANSKFITPLESDPITVWNETTGSGVTYTVEVVTDGITLTDADAWLEAEYLGTSGYPLASFASDRAADPVATPTNQDSSSVTWTTTGLTSPVKQKLSVTVTPQEKGPVRLRVCLARASTNAMYFCPLVVASSGRQWMSGEVYVNEGASGGGGGTGSAVLVNGGLVR